MALERSCAVTAVALSEQRREGAHWRTAAFELNADLKFVYVPYPSTMTGRVEP